VNIVSSDLPTQWANRLKDNMALYFECRINENALPDCFLAILPAGYVDVYHHYISGFTYYFSFINLLNFRLASSSIGRGLAQRLNTGKPITNNFNT